MILIYFKIVVIFNITSTDFVLMSADVVLKEMRIAQLCSKSEQTLQQVKVPSWAVEKQYYEMPEFQTMVILDPYGMTFDGLGVWSGLSTFIWTWPIILWSICLFDLREISFFWHFSLKNWLILCWIGKQHSSNIFVSNIKSIG